MRVVYVFRKKNPRFFSIERVFGTITGAMEGVQTERVEVPDYGLSVRNFLMLKRFASSRKDVIFHITGDCTYLALALPRKRTVVTFHDAVFLHQQKGLKRMILGLLFIKLPVYWSKHITTISDTSKKELVSYSGCAPEAIRVIGNPLTGAIARVDKSFNTSMPQILFVGVTGNKNLHNTAIALQGLQCMLHIIGKPDTEQYAWLEDNRIQYRTYTGLSDEELAEVYAGIDIVLFPSFYEGFGLPILEGFQAGRIVITSDRDPMRTIASDAAILVDPEDPVSIRKAVELAVFDEKARKEKISRGFEVVEQYQPWKIASDYRKIYSEVAELTGLAD